VRSARKEQQARRVIAQHGRKISFGIIIGK
jgi:hypothetical protein